MKYKLTPIYNYNRYDMHFKKGMFVKLIFTAPNGLHEERKWVIITKTTRLANDQHPVNFTGTLNNQSKYSYAETGEEIHFTITDILHHIPAK